jgi:8-oxo-dGTP pyrophosphatase MutT (NUDIX family)
LLVEWFAPKQIAFLPGGTDEAGEDLMATLVRELSEELAGSVLEVGRYRGEIGHRWQTGDGEDSCRNHFFEVVSDAAKLVANEPGRTMMWLELTSAGLADLQPPSLRGFLLSDGASQPWRCVDDECRGSPKQSSE